MNLPKSIKKHCDKYRVPKKFQTFLLQAVDTWITATNPLDTTTTPRNQQQEQQLFRSQTAIGWTNFTRGFLSKDWASYLQTTISKERPMKGSSTSFFSKLICVIWQEQTTFWTEYQAKRHAPTADQSQNTSKLSELNEEIRYLHSLKEQVLPAHLSTYFPRDLESFLKHSTSSQLQTYANNYGPAIKLSIQQNKDQSVANTRNILTYQGFKRITPSIPNPPTNPQENNG
jgi:hypothetical protein